ncbi:MAG: hypothetical protein A3F78_00520 [Burkholderiales bacterium RIFCSPLOWO2_12_FULL_61_40]|nr:MAG: hypothetical protein A3F78_00520 [Burkholderiales bacterium RIFCSPLOWO2_12_FULL_61_40]
MFKPIALLMAAGLLAGCQAIQEVQPWEKSTLAQETMKASGPIPALGSVDQHVYTSKEAVKGGTGIGGGGCGCN